MMKKVQQCPAVHTLTLDQQGPIILEYAAPHYFSCSLCQMGRPATSIGKNVQWKILFRGLSWPI